MARPSVAVSKLKNIGPTVARRLSAIGIRTKADLEKIGAVSAYCELKQKFPETRLPLCYYLYSLEGALCGKHWDDLGIDVKRSLKDKARRFVQ